MAKFERQVERQKKNFKFTKKEIEKQENWIKRTLSFYWIPRKWTSGLIILLNFVFVTFLAIPLLMTRFNYEVATILAHGLMTPLLIVLSFYHLNATSTKPSFVILLSRYLAVAIILFIFAVVSTMVL